MKQIVVSVAAALFFAAPAMAADMPARIPVKAAPAPVVAAAYNWSGFYIGAHGGGGWSDKCFAFPGIGSEGCHDASGWVAGGQVGYNWQAGQFVFGVEFSGSASGLDGRHTSINDPNDQISTEVRGIFLLTGRVGVAVDRLLIYVKGGGAWVRDEHEYFAGGIVPAQLSTVSLTRSGWTIGGGLEYGFTPNWSVAAEYSYIDLGRKDALFTGTAGTFIESVDQEVHLATVRLNYRFGYGAPIAARY